MTSGTAQAQAHAKQRQKAHFATAQSKRRAPKAEQGEKPAQKCAHKSHKSQRKRPLQHKFLVANSLLKELAAQKRKGHTMKRLFLIITLVLFSAGFITEAFAAPARGGGGLLKE